MKLRFIIALVIFPSAFVNAANYTGTATLEVQISDSMEVVEVEQLNFGAIKPGLSDGWVSIDAFSGSQNKVGVNVVNAGSVAQWDINGVPERNMVISLPPANAVKLTSGADEMQLDSFHTNHSGDSLQLDVNGVGSFKVGARAYVNRLQPIGNYEGAYTITLSYQ